MRIMLTGGTGLVGQKLGCLLHELKHELVVLSRDADAARARLQYPAEVHAWDAENESAPLNALEGIDAIIHLAGESIAAQRWNETQKARILRSRIRPTRNLILSLVPLGQKRPKIFISASAIGYYGNRGGEILRENSAYGAGYLSEVCRAWEKESEQVPHLGVRRCVFRIGVVLSRSGGALSKMIPSFKLGFGGPIGHGKQYMSWIHEEDLARLFAAALTNELFLGVFNATAPNPVTNEEFSQTLGEVLNRPSWFRAPERLLRAALGEMSELLLSSQRVLPERAMKLGHEFRYPDIRPALQEICT